MRRHLSATISSRQATLVFYFCASLFLHIFLFAFKNFYGLNYWGGGLQQEDDFSTYVVALKSGNFPQSLVYFNTRLFPGLPFLMLLFDFFTHNEIVAGLLLTLISLTAIFLIAYRFSKDPFYSFWITLFPPIVFEQTSKISTEAVVIALLLSVYYLFVNKRYTLAAFLSGYASIVRPIAGCMFLALFLALLVKNQKATAIKSLIFFLIFPAILALFNIYHWGAGLVFYQFVVYKQVARGAFSVPQLFQDIIRAAEWGQWRILLSGLAYFLFSFFLLSRILMAKGDFFVKDDGFLIKSWSLLTFAFVFSVGSTPILEEIRRFLTVFYPLALLAVYRYFSRRPFFLYISLLFIVFAFM